MKDFLEVVGYALILAFLWFVWAPLPLLGAGILIVLRANAGVSKGRTGAAIVAAIAAGRRALKADQDELAPRRVA